MALDILTGSVKGAVTTGLRSRIMLHGFFQKSRYFGCNYHCKYD